MSRCLACCGCDKVNGSGYCTSCGDSWGELAEKHDAHEGFGPIVLGCVLLVSAIAATVAAVWVFGGAA